MPAFGSTYLASLSILILASSSALPVKRAAESSECSNCTQVVETLVNGLYIFREISDPSSESRHLRAFLRTKIGNETGGTVLCNMLPTADLVPECWRKEQELFCYQWNLINLLDKATRVLNPGIIPNRIQWIKNELAHVSDSEAKDYVCLNYFRLATMRCEELLL